MIEAPILTLSTFKNHFLTQTDASGSGIGAAL